MKRSRTMREAMIAAFAFARWKARRLRCIRRGRHNYQFGTCQDCGKEMGRSLKVEKAENPAGK